MCWASKNLRIRIGLMRVIRKSVNYFKRNTVFTRRSFTSVIKDYKEHKATLQSELRPMKNTLWSNISSEIQSASDRKDLKTIWTFSSGICPLFVLDSSFKVKR